MSLRSTVNWGNNFSDGRSAESDEESEETEVESILDASNFQTDPMNVDVEGPVSRQSRGQSNGHQEPVRQTEVREGHLLRTSKLYNWLLGSLCALQALAMGKTSRLRDLTQ